MFTTSPFTSGTAYQSVSPVPGAGGFLALKYSVCSSDQPALTAGSSEAEAASLSGSWPSAQSRSRRASKTPCSSSRCGSAACSASQPSHASSQPRCGADLTGPTNTCHHATDGGLPSTSELETNRSSSAPGVPSGDSSVSTRSNSVQATASSSA